MRIRVGWSGETGSGTWRKVDVELENDDLLRIIVENDLPDGIDMRLPTKVCFTLLQNEAEMLLMAKLRSYGYPEIEANGRIAELIEATEEIVAAIKDKLVAA